MNVNELNKIKEEVSLIMLKNLMKGIPPIIILVAVANALRDPLLNGLREKMNPETYGLYKDTALALISAESREEETKLLLGIFKKLMTSKES